MRKLRSFSIILFIISLALFVLFRVREMSLQDRTGPVITMDSDVIEVSVEEPESKLLEGVSATDKLDGIVTSSIVVESISTFLHPGTRIVKYAAFDKDLHVTRAERQLHYTDYHSPEFSITKPLNLEPGNTNLLDYVTVSDCLDGSLTDSVKVLADRELLVDIEGEYEVRLQASNSAGDVATLPVIVKVQKSDKTIPQIRLSNYVRYLDPGEDFDPYSQIKDIVINGNEYALVDGSGNYGVEGLDPSDEIVVGKRQIVVSDSVDINTPGNYVVRYSMTVKHKNSGERVTGVTYLYVVVRDKQ